jgi:hypothetical protein
MSDEVGFADRVNAMSEYAVSTTEDGRSARLILNWDRYGEGFKDLAGQTHAVGSTVLAPVLVEFLGS